VKRRKALVIAGLVGAVALIASLAAATVGSARPTVAKQSAVITAPPVPNAAKLRAKYKGIKLTFVGDNAVGGSHVRDLALAKRFTKDTGIQIKVLPHPEKSDESYSQLARNFSSKSSAFDVVMMDVVWPGAFAPYLVNLKPALGAQAKLHAQGIVQNDTVGGKLIAMPWFGDFGILYYRTDLLKKYGYKSPPKTWTQLGTMAKKIENGEKAANPNFAGFVYQGNSYEGLTCDALEWVASVGGGHFIDNGKASINNTKAANVLNLMRSWVGNIAPRGVTSYGEEEARIPFTNGNAAFMRNWPYAYSSGVAVGSKIKGKFSVTVLPHGPGASSVGTVGGWQLGVSKFSKHKPAAIEFVRYMTSAAVERFNAITNSNVPTIPSVAKDPAVRRTNPYLKPEIATVARVTRPSRYLKGKYNEGSKIIYQGINQILNGADAKSVLPGIASRLNRLLK
jgi:trehalose/maltose transport system substrate-binding protein